jgi:hypothetical protein
MDISSGINRPGIKSQVRLRNIREIAEADNTALPDNKGYFGSSAVVFVAETLIKTLNDVEGGILQLHER